MRGDEVDGKSKDGKRGMWIPLEDMALLSIREH